MSESKTYLSRRFPAPFHFEQVTPAERLLVEKSLEFTPARRLAAVQDKIGKDRFVLASGKSAKQVGRYLRGDNTPTAVLEALSRECGVSIDWLARGVIVTAADLSMEEEMLGREAGSRLTQLTKPKPEPRYSTLGYGLKIIDERLAELDKIGRHALPAISEQKDAADTVLPRRAPSTDGTFAFLPFYEDVAAAAGAGAAVVADASHSIIGFDRQFLRDAGASPQTCTVIRAKGDSMSPTIPDGSMLIVDHSQREVANGCIMVIGIGDDLLVKRVRRRLDGLIDLISDNSAYAPETLGPAALQQLRVVGRVVYFCRTP